MKRGSIIGLSHRLDRLLPPLFFLLFFFLYALMGSPGLEWGDAGEAQLAAWQAGLSHPTGYPLYLMLGWLWTHGLTLLGVAPTRAMTLFSALAAAATVAACMPMLAALLRRSWLGLGSRAVQAIAAMAALCFGFSYTFWSQALIAEVYALNALFLVLLLWGLWARGQDTRALPWLALLYGLALGHHRTMLLWVPGLLLWLWVEQRAVLTPRRALTLLALVALPQLLYLYIPWRGPLSAYLHQPLAEGAILTLYDGSPAAFWAHVTGTTFAGELGLKEPLAARLALLWRFSQQNLPLPLLVTALLGSLTLVTPLGVLLSLRLADRLLLWSGALLTILFGLLYAIGDVEVMFIPAWLALTILGFAGIALLLRYLLLWPELPARLRYGLVMALLMVPLLLQLRHEPPSRAANQAPRLWVERLLAAEPPPGAILITNDRDEMVPLWYAQFAEGRRPDLLGLFPLVTADPAHRDVRSLVEWALQWGRPVFLTKPMPGLALRFELAEEGALVRVRGPAALPESPPLEGALAPALTVVGWEPSTLRPQPGEVVTLALALEPQAPLAAPLTFSLQLFGLEGEPLAQQERAPDPFYPAPLWSVGEALRLPLTMTLPLDAAPGLYEWRLSAYHLAGEQIVPLGQQIVVGRFLMGVAPPPLGELDDPLARFGPGLLLAGVDRAEAPPRAGAPVEFILHWVAQAAPRRPYTLFVHLLDEGGTLRAQADAPLDPPTDTWVAGDQWHERRVLPLPADLPPGRYSLWVGLYDEQGRLPVAGGGDAVELFTLTLEE